MERYKHVRGQVQCAVAFLLVWSLEFGVGSRDGQRPSAKKWIYNEFGKPYFDGRDDLFFSVSHCRNAVAAVIADEEVGIDIEEISRYRESLVKYTLSEEEMEVDSSQLTVNEDPRFARNDRFIRIWTRKEAAFKCYGTGITHDIKNVLKRGDLDIYSVRVGDDKWLSVAKKANWRNFDKNHEIPIEFIDVTKILKNL